MAHKEQREFCESVKESLPHYFDHAIVLDVGSLDINGSNRDLFNNCVYHGCDISAGKNVNVVSRAHELRFEDEKFNTIISTECFEHDMFYHFSLLNIARMLDKNGLFVFTCATTGRAEHGTAEKLPKDSPFTASIDGWKTYYKNLTEEDIRLILDIDSIFSVYEFDKKGTDLRFFGIKKDKHENTRFRCRRIHRKTA